MNLFIKKEFFKKISVLGVAAKVNPFFKLKNIK